MLPVVIGVGAVVIGGVVAWLSEEERQRKQQEEERQRRQQEEERQRRQQERQRKQQEQEKRLLDSGIYKVDTMTGKEFEDFLDVCFRKLGYNVSLTPNTQDYGGDLILYKDGIKTVVQAKRKKSSVSISAVQEVVSAIKHYKADEGMVITNNYFTTNAYNLARSNDIKLWDRKKLVEFMLRAKNASR